MHASLHSTGDRPQAPSACPTDLLDGDDRLNHLSTIPANWRLWICTGELPACGRRAGQALKNVSTL